MRLLSSSVVGVAILVGSPSSTAASPTVRPEARVETEPVPGKGDSADDPAVWIHPDDPHLSLVLGTDKTGGLHVYNMDGSERQTFGDRSAPNNVDVLYGFELDGRAVDLAIASVRPKKEGRGVKVWTIDAASRTLTDVTAGGRIQVFGGSEPYGMCGYRSARTGRSFFFVTSERGNVEQYELVAADGGRVTGRKVRTLRLGSVTEGCVSDNDLGFVYFSEELAGIWKFAAEPDGDPHGRMIARAGQNGLTADIEGIALYDAGKGRGYLIVSSQGNDTFKVYERGGENRYVLTIDPAHGPVDDVAHTDGIAVSNCPTSREFGDGVFVVHDGANENGNQNFKLFAWRDVAGQRLLVDTECRARPGRSGL